MAITASDVNKLRQQTGAGMMDCKNALVEANGDFEAAVDILRKKGQKIAQAVLCPVINGKFVTLHEVIELNEKERGSNGFGSTGI